MELSPKELGLGLAKRSKSGMVGPIGRDLDGVLGINIKKEIVDLIPLRFSVNHLPARL